MWPLAKASGQDSVRTHTLRSINITTNRPATVTAKTPTYMVTAEKIDQSGSLQLSDVVKQIPGITLKDYGGIGGMKTVSARGLGSQFSTLTIDGVAVNDCQNGQIDLGRYLLGNADYVSFAYGQHDIYLQSARSYAAGNVLNISTQQPVFFARNYNLSLAFEGGSFGMLSPTLQWDQRLSPRLSLSVWANHLQSKGNYPFTLYYTASHADSSSTEYRQNSQMQMSTVDANLFYRIASTQHLTLKIHGATSFHALPGPATFYTVKGGESTNSRIFFVQSTYRNRISEQWHWQILAKYSLTNDIYQDTTQHYDELWLRNEYQQQEGYLSTTLAHYFTDRLSLSVAADEALSQLSSNLSHNSRADRFSSQEVIALTYTSPIISANANILCTLINEHTNDQEEHTYRKISPYAGVSTRLMLIDSADKVHSLRLRYFVKENYRVPNFNEMYYFTLSRSLRPEKAWQNDIGLVASGSFVLPSATLHSHYTVSLDAYFNRVADKIVAVPMQSLFLWSMMNLGKVNIWGAELAGEARMELANSAINLSANYAYQYAVDVTDPSSKTYRQQIAYTPRHSGGANIYWENRWVDIGYNLVAVGRRYRLGQNTPNNLVHGYIDQGIIVAKHLNVRNTKVTIKAQVLNLFDVQYEVIKNYPMMGRNYRIGINWIF